MTDKKTGLNRDLNNFNSLDIFGESSIFGGSTATANAAKIFCCNYTVIRVDVNFIAFLRQLNDNLKSSV